MVVRGCRLLALRFPVLFWLNTTPFFSFPFDKNNESVEKVCFLFPTHLFLCWVYFSPLHLTVCIVFCSLRVCAHTHTHTLLANAAQFEPVLCGKGCLHFNKVSSFLDIAMQQLLRCGTINYSSIPSKQNEYYTQKKSVYLPMKQGYNE